MKSNGAVAECTEGFVRFDVQRELVLHDDDGHVVRSIARLDAIDPSAAQVHAHGSYVCVAERYGLTAVVVDLESGCNRQGRRI